MFFDGEGLGCIELHLGDFLACNFLISLTWFDTAQATAKRVHCFDSIIAGRRMYHSKWAVDPAAVFGFWLTSVATSFHMARSAKVTRSALVQCFRATKLAFPGDVLLAVLGTGVLAPAHLGNDTFLAPEVLFLCLSLKVKFARTVNCTPKKWLFTISTLVESCFSPLVDLTHLFGFLCHLVHLIFHCK